MNVRVVFTLHVHQVSAITNVHNLPSADETSAWELRGSLYTFYHNRTGASCPFTGPGLPKLFEPL